jgi:hypothetical protein
VENTSHIQTQFLQPPPLGTLLGLLQLLVLEVLIFMVHLLITEPWLEKQNLL